MYITTTTLLGGVPGAAYSMTLGVAGNTGAVTWAITAGSLPPGLLLYTATGVISGTPTTVGQYNFTLRATDSGSNQASCSYTVWVDNVVFSEAVDSRKTKGGFRDRVWEMNSEKIYFISGTDDPSNPTILNQLPAYGTPWPSGIGSLAVYVTSWDLTVVKVADAYQSGVIRAVINYGPPQRVPPTDGTQQIEYDVGCENLHVEQAPYGQDHYPSNQNKASTLIGVNGDQVTGCDISSPKCNFTITQELVNLPSGLATMLRDQAGTINNASWKGFNSGEVLFLGARCQQRGTGKWQVQWQFAVSPNVSLQVTCWNDGSPSVQTVSKGGWDYIWYERKDGPDGNGGILRLVNAVHVAHVYNQTAFSGLGL